MKVGRIDQSRAGEHDYRLRCEPSGGVQQQQQAATVDVKILEWRVVARGRARLPGQMKDEVAALNGLLDDGLVTDVAFVETNSVASGDGRTGRRPRTTEYPHIRPQGIEPGHEVGAHEAKSARDQRGS